MSRLDKILHELSDALDAPLHADEQNVCRIEINELIQIQLEIDRYEEHLFLICDIAPIPPGSYREPLFKSVLRANHGAYQQFGILSFVPKHNYLMLHLKQPIGSLDIDELIQTMVHFTNKAHKWRLAIQEGKTHPQGAFDESTSSSLNKIPPGMKS